jgi:tRNA A37 methylthiotransferase MiaB
MENKFGTAEVIQIDDLCGSIHIVCTACQSILSEGLSWANRHPERIAPIEFADHIIVASCQVTDLAILNDFNHLKELMAKYPEANFYVGGCLAWRFDIPLPEGVQRIGFVREDYTHIKDRSVVTWVKPFWVRDFKEDDEPDADGHLFRNHYPLRIGVGCRGKCEYCTIRTTRGQPYELHPHKEFVEAEGDIVLIADFPSANQLIEWCDIIYELGKAASFRNVEPQMALAVWSRLVELSKLSLLPIFHCPVQSGNAEILRRMGRNVEATLQFIEKVRRRELVNTKVATNVIWDYQYMEDRSLDNIDAIFDQVSWNQYWDGKWDEERAKRRWRYYLGND